MSLFSWIKEKVKGKKELTKTYSTAGIEPLMLERYIKRISDVARENNVEIITATHPRRNRTLGLGYNTTGGGIRPGKLEIVSGYSNVGISMYQSLLEAQRAASLGPVFEQKIRLTPATPIKEEPPLIPRKVNNPVDELEL